MLGVMGGGQLGRMFVHAAQAMGYRTAVLDPDPASPAGSVSHLHILSAYDDPAGLAKLARRCAAVTTEFENVPAAGAGPAGHAARRCARAPTRWPSARIARLEKAHFAHCGVPCAPMR